MNRIAMASELCREKVSFIYYRDSYILFKMVSGKCFYVGRHRSSMKYSQYDFNGLIGEHISTVGISILKDRGLNGLSKRFTFHARDSGAKATVEFLYNGSPLDEPVLRILNADRDLTEDNQLKQT